MNNDSLLREAVIIQNGRQGRRPFEAQRVFRAALAVFRRKMEAEADKTESPFAVGKYICGSRLKKLFEKSFLRIFKNF